MPSSVLQKSSVLIICFLISVTALIADDPSSAIPDGFQSPETTESYRAAVELFERGEFSDAKKKFKEAGKGAKGDAKDSVKSYEKACKGEKDLEKIEKEISRGKWQAALVVLKKAHGKYGKTPLTFHLDQLRTTVEENFYLLLSDFELEPSEHERPVMAGRPRWGPPHIMRKNLVHSGEASLTAFASGKIEDRDMFGVTSGISYPLVRFNGEWAKDYGTISIWVYAISDKKKEEVMLYLTETEDGSFEEKWGGSGQEQLLRNSRLMHVTKEVPTRRWHEVRINLDRDFTNRFDLKVEDMKTLCVGRGLKSQVKLYLDTLRLERR